MAPLTFSIAHYFAFTSMVPEDAGCSAGWRDVRIWGDAGPLWFPACRAQQLSVRFVLGIPLGFSCEKVLATALDANLSIISVSQNKDTKRLAAWAAIIAAPTAIAGIYGMNFQYMPELGWKYGYETVLVGMAAVCGGLWLGFNRSGWL